MREVTSAPMRPWIPRYAHPGCEAKRGRMAGRLRRHRVVQQPGMVRGILLARRRQPGGSDQWFWLRLRQHQGDLVVPVTLAASLMLIGSGLAALRLLRRGASYPSRLSDEVGRPP